MDVSTRRGEGGVSLTWTPSVNSRVSLPEAGSADELPIQWSALQYLSPSDPRKIDPATQQLRLAPSEVGEYCVHPPGRCSRTGKAARRSGTDECMFFRRPRSCWIGPLPPNAGEIRSRERLGNVDQPPGSSPFDDEHVIPRRRHQGLVDFQADTEEFLRQQQTPSRCSSGRSTVRKRCGMRSVWPWKTSSAPGSTGSPTARCGASTSTWDFLQALQAGLEAAPPGPVQAAPALIMRQNIDAVCQARRASTGPCSSTAGSAGVQAREYRHPGHSRLAGYIGNPARSTPIREQIKPLGATIVNAVKASSPLDRLHPARRPAACRAPGRSSDLDSGGQVRYDVEATTIRHATPCAETLPGATMGHGRTSPALRDRRTPISSSLEFASREMAEVELLAELPETMDVAVEASGRRRPADRAARPRCAEQLQDGAEVRRRRPSR